jgi:hypothetical protein
MNEFLSRIATFFDKDMLFASLLPALLFIFSLLGVIIHILGVNTVIELYSNLSANLSILLGILGFVSLIAFCYVLYALRDLLLRFWSGESNIFYFHKIVYMKRFLELRKMSLNARNWPREYQKFSKKLETYVKADLPLEKEEVMLNEIDQLFPSASEDSIRTFISNLIELKNIYQYHTLDKIYLKLSTTILKWAPPAIHENVQKLRAGYSNFRLEVDSIPPQATQVDEKTKFSLLESLWIFQTNKEAAKPDEFFELFTDAHKKFSSESLQIIRIKLLDILAEVDNNVEGMLKYGMWTTHLKEIFRESDPPKIVMTCEQKKSWYETIETVEIKAIKDFDRDSDASTVRNLLNHILELYKTKERVILSNVYQELTDLNDKMEARDQRFATSIDRNYGSLGTIKGTKLGNVIQAYNEYSFKRYRIEAEVFWPRLQFVINENYKSLISDHKIKLDFSITCTSLGTAFLLFCLCGPLIYSSLVFWATIFILTSLVIVFGYQMSVSSAESLGQVVRSAYDLHRLELLKSLKLEFPDNTIAERRLWESYSQFVLYGESETLILKDRAEVV